MSLVHHLNQLTVHTALYLFPLYVLIYQYTSGGEYMISRVYVVKDDPKSKGKEYVGDYNITSEGPLCYIFAMNFSSFTFNSSKVSSVSDVTSDVRPLVTSPSSAPIVKFFDSSE